MRLYSLIALTVMLTISNLTTATIIKRLRDSSTEIMQLKCTTGMPAEMCNTLWGTDCSSSGVIIQPAPASFENGDCSSAHCTCVRAAPVPCITGAGGVSVCGFGASQAVSSSQFQTTQVVGLPLTSNSGQLIQLTGQPVNSNSTELSGPTMNSAPTSYRLISAVAPVTYCATVTVVTVTHTHHHYHNSSFNDRSRHNRIITGHGHHDHNSTYTGGRHSMTATGHSSHHHHNKTLSPGHHHHSVTMAGIQL